MIKSLQPQEEARTRLGRKMCIILSGLREGVTLCHTLSQRKTPNGGEAEETGASGRLRQQPLLGFPRESEGRAE